MKLTDIDIQLLVKSVEAPNTMDAFNNGVYTLTPDEMLAFAHAIAKRQRGIDARLCRSLCSVMEEAHEFYRCAEAIENQ